VSGIPEFIFGGLKHVMTKFSWYLTVPQTLSVTLVSVNSQSLAVSKAVDLN
jgi:hypothetical protein